MSVRNLDKLFNPRSVALIDANSKPGSVSAVVLRNLRRSRFSGELMVVSSGHQAIDGLPVHPDVARAMARGVRDRARADWGLATTGVAGPDQQDGQDPGTVHVAVTSAAGDHVLSLRLVGDRSAVRTVATANALDLLRRAVLGLATDPEHPW